MSVLRGLRVFGSDNRATVSVELALTLPLLITLLGSGLEITNYVLIHQKVERTSATISDLVAQSARMTEREMTSLFSATGYVMKPFDLATDGNVVVSSISASGGNPPVISWQRSSGGGHNGSRFGAEGAAASLPAGLERTRRRQHHRLRGLLPLPADAVQRRRRRDDALPLRLLPPALRQARRHLSVAFWRASPHPRFALPLPGGRGSGAVQTGDMGNGIDRGHG